MGKTIEKSFGVSLVILEKTYTIDTPFSTSVNRKNVRKPGVLITLLITPRDSVAQNLPYRLPIDSGDDPVSFFVTTIEFFY